jgi:hypothetical protein
LIWYNYMTLRAPTLLPQSIVTNLTGQTFNSSKKFKMTRMQRRPLNLNEKHIWWVKFFVELQWLTGQKSSKAGTLGRKRFCHEPRCLLKNIFDPSNCRWFLMFDRSKSQLIIAVRVKSHFARLCRVSKKAACVWRNSKKPRHLNIN